MAGQLLPYLNRATDSDDNPLSGAKFYFYVTGTTTPQSVYTTDDLGTPHANPVVADSAGLFAPIYLDASLEYRGVLKTSDDATTVLDIDPINADALAQLASTDTGKGAQLVTYKPGLATTGITRGVGDKLDENRSVLDFIPYARHADIIAGTSTWDAASTVNAGIADVGGKHIDMTAARKLAIGSPIELVRGTFLKGNGSFDTVTGAASTIFLLDGAQCAAIQSPSAHSNEAATHYIGLEGLLIDGNGANQVNTTPGGIVQFYGLFVGSYMRMVFVRSPRGPGIVLGSGPDQDTSVGSGAMDVQLSHIWVNGAILDAGEYAFDTNMAYYASNVNGDFSANRNGLCEIDFLYVENSKAAFADDPRNNLAHRTRNGARFHATESLLIGKLHTESVIHGTTLTSNKSVSILKPSGAWIGDNVAADEALISIGSGNLAVHIGESEMSAGTPASPLRGYAIRKASGYTSTDFPDLEQNGSGLPVAGSYYARATGSVKHTMSNSRAANIFEVLRAGVDATMRFGVADSTMAEYGFVKQTGDTTIIGSNANQGSDKTFISFLSNGDTSDRIALNDPFRPGIRTSATGIPAGYMAWVGATSAQQYLYCVTPGNSLASVPVTTSNAGTPVGSVTPISGVGRHFVYDTVGNDLYCSTGATSSDWKKLTP